MTSREQHCETFSRRQLLASAAALGAAAMLPRWASAQSAAAAAPHRIDTHHHFFSPEWKKTDAEFAAKIGGPKPFTGSWTPEKSFEDMEKGGVAMAVLSLPSIPSNWFGGDPKTAVRVSHACNEYGAGLVRDHPGRFGLFASLPMLDVDASLKELEYALDTLKADGIGLATAYGDKWPGDPMFKPIFEEINRRKAVVYFHPLTPNCCHNLLPGVNDAVLEVPEDTSRAVTSLLLSGTFARLRDIKWLFSHAGGTLPSIAGRIDSFFAGDHPLKDLAEIAPNGIYAEFAKLNFDLANAAWPASVAGLRKLVPTSQILYGSDYPYFRCAMNAEAVNKLGFTAAELQGIDRGNALRLLPSLKPKA